MGFLNDTNFLLTSKYKVNIKLDETEFHQNVPVQKIMIRSDADRRSAFIDLRCNSATSHKLAVLFVKEFELIISKFEDYFKTVGLKLYYITPKIEKSNLPNAIDNYNFEAYIPTLIPLLTGDNIYAKKEVFARELIQNSIDAIAVRSSTDKDFDQTIYITLGQSQGRMFFRIKDFGTGMDRFKIERYFTSIGRSFYSGDEYRDLEIDYKPISNFGIGFLSAFMVCREIDVKTRYYLDEEEGLKLHIPNYDGCFFIEKDDTLDIGTEITLYIDKKISHNIQQDEIINYICDTMKDISCNIVIQDDINKNKKTLESKTLRKNISNNDILFIPFLDSGNIVKNVSIEKTIRTSDFIEKYSYGLFVDLTGKNQIGAILNSGIKLYDTDVDDVCRLIFNIDSRKIRYLNRFFLFNFPSNYLNIDVSREKITSLNEDVIESDFKINLMGEMSRQVIEYINLCKIGETTNTALSLHLLMMTLVQICKQDSELSRFRNELMSIRYVLYIRYNENTIDLIVSRLGNKLIDAIPYIQNNYAKCDSEFRNFAVFNSIKNGDKIILSQLEPWHKIVPDVRDLINRNICFVDDVVDEFYPYKYDKEHFPLIQYLQERFKSKDDRIVYTFFLVSAFLVRKRDEKSCIAIMDNILGMLLEQYTVSEIENGECAVSIRQEDIKKVIKKLS